MVTYVQSHDWPEFVVGNGGTLPTLPQESLDAAAPLPPSDTGLDGAIPLEPYTWEWTTLDDATWAAQNRKMNDLLRSVPRTHREGEAMSPRIA